MHSALPVQVVKSNHVSDERRCLREERPSLFILLRIGFKGTGSSFFFFFERTSPLPSSYSSSMIYCRPTCNLVSYVHK